VLDRTKEPGSIGEPLYLDVVAALAEAHADGERPVHAAMTGGRYGLSSKEFTPAMVAGVFAELAREQPRRRFTIGIDDDVSGTSVDYDPSFDIESPDTFRAVFFGLGSDGTVSANKNTIKILGSEEGLHAQGYFVYDSKKSGSQTESHLRFGPDPIRAPYLVTAANFVGCHQFRFLDKLDVLGRAAPDATLLLNCRQPAAKVWDALPRLVQEQILAKRITLYASTPPGSHVRPGWPGGSTSCCRHASSRSPTCCPASRRSPDQAIGGKDVRKPRRRRAGRKNWPQWTARWPGYTGSRCPPWSHPRAHRHRPCPSPRRSSSARSPRR
jgi:hypothetical protein